MFGEETEQDVPNLNSTGCGSHLYFHAPQLRLHKSEP